MALNLVADTGHFIVEQHLDDSTRAHIFVWSEKKPFKKRISNSGDNVPRIEVKGEGNDSLVSVTPSPHTNGSNYEFVGDWHLAVMEPKIHNQIEEHINTICERFGIEYLNGDARRGPGSSPYSGNYENENQKIPIGERHNTLLSYANKLIARLFKTETPKICPVYGDTVFLFPLPLMHIESYHTRSRLVPALTLTPTRFSLLVIHLRYKSMTFRVGRKGFEPSNPAMSRRYLNQARPPAHYSCQTLIRPYKTLIQFI